MLKKILARTASSLDSAKPQKEDAAVEEVEDGSWNRIAAPTKAHWMPKDAAHMCAVRTCRREFGWLEAKNNCSRCGKVVCTPHFGSFMRLNEHAVPSDDGVECKVCDECVLVERRRLQRARRGVDPVPTGYELPTLSDDITIPDVIEQGDDAIFPQSVVSHLGEQLVYMSSVHRMLSSFHDSTLRRAYMDTERDAFLLAASTIKEHVGTITKLIESRHPQLTPPTTEFLRECVSESVRALEWANSSSIYMLLSGASGTASEVIGELPEDDFAVVERDVARDERRAANMMSKLFNALPAEKDALLGQLRFLMACMEHDYHEYSRLPGPEMEHFQTRLSKCVQYTSMHIDSFTGKALIADMQANIASYERKFIELLDSANEASLKERSSVRAIRDNFAALKVDIGVCRNLLVRSPAAAIDPEANRALIKRLDDLEADIDARMSGIYGHFEVDADTLRGRAADAYQSLQLARAREEGERAQDELFEL